MSNETSIAVNARALEQLVYRAVMEFAPWPMAEVEGTAHVVHALNPSFCALLEKSEDELLGKPIAQLFADGHATHGLLDRVRLSGEAATHVETARNTPGPVYWSYTCWPLQAKEGRHVGLMIQVTETSKVDQQTKDMNEALLISSVQQHELTADADRLNKRLTEEISERERAQHLLRLNHETFFNLIEHAPFGIYVVDARTRIHQVNAVARAVFAHVDPLIGRDFSEAVHILWSDPFASEVLERFRETLLTGIPYASTDSTHQRVDINVRESYDWKIERINLPDGGFGVVCYFYDISTMKQAQESLQEADQHKSEFLATLAHELRNPLAPLRNGLELLAMAREDHPTWDQTHGMMTRQMDHMVRLIDELMDLSRISRGVIDLRNEQFDLRAVLEQAMETSRPLIEQRGHRWVLDLPDECVTVNGDSMRLTQVFCNLLNNAAKYTDRGGDIALRAHVGDGEVRVMVQDNGIGIALDQQVKVFDMFAQVERANERVQGGIGIGLNIVKHLVEMHQGRIEVLSGGAGAGSTFTVVLPMAQHTRADVHPAKPSATATVAPMRILIVDDNEDAATMMAMLLGRLGHDVRVAHNGQQALAEGELMKPSLVLLDIGMPVMDGHLACQNMKRAAWGRAAYVVALTGLGQDEDRRKSRESGFDHHLVKPVGSAVLTKMIVAAEQAGKS